MSRIKTSTLGGRWYAGGAARLREQVDGLLRAAGRPAARGGRLAGLVVPHAGYAYSGRAAAAGYAALAAGPCRRAVILAPSHFSRFRGAAVLDVDGFETPLGVVAVDTRAVARLVHQPLFREDAAPFRDEHSLEIQLPFLQRVLPAVQVVPVLLGDLAEDDYDPVGSVLRGLDEEGTVFIASSDFVHYGADFGYLPFPAEGPERVRAGLRRLDMGAVDRVCAGDGEGFRRYVAETGATICGRVPIAVLLELLPPPKSGTLLTYYTSLDVTGDYEHCVSYASVAFARAGGRDA
jgi:AmmeMemoRadiSam system protein B